MSVLFIIFYFLNTLTIDDDKFIVRYVNEKKILYT